MLNDKTQVILDLYQNWLDAWNSRNAVAMAKLFAEDGNLIGFDGSQINGSNELQITLTNIFAHHATAAYVALVREIRLLSPGVAWLKAEVGMIPTGKTDINPALNTVQTMIALKNGDDWQITLFQNTPAAFHAMPEMAEQLSAELRALLNG